MSTIRNLVRPLAVALTLAFVAIPATALAEGNHPAHGHETKAHDKQHRRFPLDAKRFQEHVEKRIARMRDRIERGMEKHKVPNATRAEIRKDFEVGAAAVRAAVTRVAADGEVTREEAREVKDLARGLRQKAHEKHGHGGKKGADA